MPRKRPKKLITLDTETYNGLKGDLKRIAIYDGVDVTYGYKFKDIEPKLNEWYKQGYALEIYIHNLEFDLRKIPEILNRKNVKWSQTRLINGKYVIVACKKYTLHDSFKLLPMSLKALSEAFDIENGKLDLWEEVQKKYPNQYTDIVDFLDRCDVDDELYLKYLGYDVISLYEVIEKLCDVSGLSFEDLSKCMTTASMSKKIFKNGFKGIPFKSEGMNKTDFEMLTKNKWWSSDKEIHANYSDTPVSYKEIEDKIRQSYCGGRTEVFKTHLKPDNNKIVGYHMDFNSLYPSQMIDNDFPVGAPEFYTDAETIKFNFKVWQRHRKGLGFIKAKIFIPECKIPPLPIKKGKLVFPCGYVEGTWTYNELAHAIEKYNVEVVEYLEQIHFCTTFKIFKNLIGTLSKIKEQAKNDNNKALYNLSKLLMNTAYGWTALIRERSALAPIEKIEKYEDKIISIDEELGCIEVENIVISETVQVQVASYVTSYARLSLLNAFETLTEMGAEIYYCDTDSIVSNMKLPDEMLHPTKLGLLDVEGLLTEGIFIQPKVYYESVSKKTYFKENIKFKGVSKDTQKTFDRRFIVNLYNTFAEQKESYIIVENQKEMLRSIRYMQNNNLDFNYYEVRDKKLYILNQQKRIMDYNNNSTSAHFIESFDAFYNFDLSPNLEPLRDENRNIFNPIM